MLPMSFEDILKLIDDTNVIFILSFYIIVLISLFSIIDAFDLISIIVKGILH